MRGGEKEKALKKKQKQFREAAFDGEMGTFKRRGVGGVGVDEGDGGDGGGGGVGRSRA